MNRDRQDAFQRGVLLVAIIETVYWVYLLVGGLTDQLPFAKDYGEVAAVLGTFVFVPFVLPALVLAVRGRALGLAATLCTIGGVLYGMDPLYRVTTLVDDVPVSGVFAVGFVIALAGTAVLLTRRKRAT
jgi:hypothetical protein